MKIVPKTLSGFMELLPSDQVRFNYFLEKIKASYESFGFLPLDTPVIEFADVLLAKNGGETEKQVYKFEKGSTSLALRFDLTVPLAKYVALYHNNLNFPFKRYQIGKVFRGEKAQHGRFREFYQCDIDIIGHETLDIINDAEILNVIYHTFKKIGFDDFIIKINNRKILKGFFEFIGMNGSSVDILSIIDKKNKIEREEMIKELEKLNLSKKNISNVFELINISGKCEEKLDILKNMNVNNGLFMEGLEELEKVLKYVELFGIPKSNFEIDLTIARGLDYYTGIVYETFLNGHKELGSVCSGGRYDNLCECYMNKKMPGVGISIGLTRLFSEINKIDVFSNLKKTVIDVIIIPIIEEKGKCLPIATYLREEGINTDFIFSDKRIKNKFSYADKLGVQFALILGEKELNTGLYTLKDLFNSSQELLNLDDIVSKIKKFKNKTNFKKY